MGEWVETGTVRSRRRHIRLGEDKHAHQEQKCGHVEVKEDEDQLAGLLFQCFDKSYAGLTVSLFWIIK